MFCSEVLSDDLHVSHVSLCVYVIRCLCFQSCCYLNTCVRVDEAWGCPAHKNKSNVEIKWFSSRAGNLLLWLIENASYPSWHSPPAPGRWLCGRRPAWCRRPGWRTWGRQWWSPVCLLKPGEKKKQKKTWHQTNIYDHNRPSLGLFSLPSSPQRTFRLQTTAATSCRGWPAACRWRATSPRCRATRRSPWFSPTPARRCRNPCCPGSQEAERVRMRLIRLYQQNNTSHFLSSTEKT